MTILLAILAGGALGYVLARGDFCFHSVFRNLVADPPRADLLRAYLLLVLVATPLVQGMREMGWIDPSVPWFEWRANLVGGVIFGFGMVIAASCITGLFYKLGHGMLGTAIGIAAWSVGDVVTYRGPLRDWRDDLSSEVVTGDGRPATVTNWGGGIGWALLVVAGGVIAAWLWRSRLCDRQKLWNWLVLGMAAAVVTSAAWLLADAHGADYTYGTSSVPTAVWDGLTLDGLGSRWILLALVSIVPGSYVAARAAGTLWIRGETARRLLQLGAGGFVMGVGAAVSSGCNLGHSMVGVPLLSMASVTTTAAMAAGVAMADRVVRARGRRWVRDLHPSGRV